MKVAAAPGDGSGRPRMPMRQTDGGSETEMNVSFGTETLQQDKLYKAPVFAVAPMMDWTDQF
ncbi:hypothetical protein [Pannonibacter tanglangensis]|uniref:Dihydrouridine synthase (Dus) n=1 Tax=Pannonibacter tanglangensis TaxID=2750084 RepID=A0ABW9ZDR9_9HYPH|nr:hypothetical protein [Pannonibacter sp. XCT-34]NBN62823.1 hypothetical protein [Pannonibacter sp. XCT-34]